LLINEFVVDDFIRKNICYTAQVLINYTIRLILQGRNNLRKQQSKFQGKLLMHEQ